MCGICGIFFSDRNWRVQGDSLAGMNGRIVHRGPDDGGGCLLCRGGLGSLHKLGQGEADPRAFPLAAVEEQIAAHQLHQLLGDRQAQPRSARGFVGIAFRVQDDASRFECFYLRPTNGRSFRVVPSHPFDHATYYPGAVRMAAKLIFDPLPGIPGKGSYVGTRIMGPGQRLSLVTGSEHRQELHIIRPA